MTQNTGVCQSCGMPMKVSQDFGTESDGSASLKYCHFCYQNGTFTDPDISIDEMAERTAPIMNQMFEMPMDTAKIFLKEQLENLYRWSGREIPLCESCGMALSSDDVCGTELDGSPSRKYCMYCYQKGSFTEPDLTRESMIKKYAPLMASRLGIPVHKAEEMTGTFTAVLPRWKQ